MSSLERDVSNLGSGRGFAYLFGNNWGDAIPIDDIGAQFDAWD